MPQPPCTISGWLRLTFAAAACLCCVQAGESSDLPPAPARHFNDSASVVENTTEQQINARLEQCEKDTTNQVEQPILISTRHAAPFLLSAFFPLVGCGLFIAFLIGIAKSISRGVVYGGGGRSNSFWANSRTMQHHDDSSSFSSDSGSSFSSSSDSGGDSSGGGASGSW